MFISRLAQIFWTALGLLLHFSAILFVKGQHFGEHDYRDDVYDYYSHSADAFRDDVHDYESHAEDAFSALRVFQPLYPKSVAQGGQVSCETHTKIEGVCQSITKCRSVLNNYHHVIPTVCFWDHKKPYVCCPERRIGTTTKSFKDDVYDYHSSTMDLLQDDVYDYHYTSTDSARDEIYDYHSSSYSFSDLRVYRPLYPRKVGEVSCENRRRVEGVCRSILSCRSVLNNYQQVRPTICFWDRNVPHVCCDERNDRSTPTRRPVSTTRTSVFTTRRPVSTTRRSVFTTRRPVSTTRRSVFTTRRPVSTTRRSAFTTRRPVSTTRTSVFTTRRPVSTTRRTIAIIEKPFLPTLRISECGVRPSSGVQERSFEAFAVGGKEVNPNSWPWMAAIRVHTYDTNTRFLCGGSLISQRYVMSAAHCFGEKGRTRSPSQYSVHLGAHNQKEGIPFRVKTIKVHEDYKNNFFYDDISLLELDTDVAFTKDIVPACLPTPAMSRANFHNLQATVTGWGDLSYGGVASETLQEVTFPIIPTSVCDEAYKRVAASSFPRGIDDKMICAGAMEGGRDACQGDSGGPLVLIDEEGKWTQVGIVSFGFRCAEQGFPGVYTQIGSYLQWIQRNSDLGQYTDDEN